MWVLIHHREKKTSGLQRPDSSKTLLNQDEFTIPNHVDLESPPTEEELNLLVEGHEQRILKAVLARLRAESDTQEGIPQGELT